MDMLEAVRLCYAQPIEQREDHERSKSLRRRRGIVERTDLRHHTERFGHDRPIFFQISTRHWAADSIEISSNFAADVTAIEIVKAGMSEMLESRGKFSLFEPRADVRHLAVE